MDGRPLLVKVARALAVAKLEAILIGNAAAALHGAPVTTLDLDFLFRSNAANLRKLKIFARELEATVLRPYYPASEMFRVMNDESGLQVDFMAHIHGVRSFEGVRSRSSRVDFDGAPLLVAHLEDIFKSKRAAGRPKDRAVLEVLRKTLDESQKKPPPP